MLPYRLNFFAVLRDQHDELIRSIGLTPFSREELVKACGSSKNLSRLERARRFYVRARQTRTGLAQTSSEGRWDHSDLAAALHDLKGRAVLSGYRCDLYDELFGGWRRVDAPAGIDDR